MSLPAERNTDTSSVSFADTFPSRGRQDKNCRMKDLTENRLHDITPEMVPEEARDILQKLNEAGYEAFVVGGCVRDCLLGKTPADWDITTSARPEQVKAVFSHTVDTGLQHGTVTVMQKTNGKLTGYEVTTYRIDGEYEDARHPKEVIFTAELAEDLKRRDFTINAMAYHPEAGLQDLFHGREDLEAGVIRCVGEAKERFTEDALRMMRAIRFAAQLDAQIEPLTWEAIKALAPNIEKVSAERIRVEMEKLLVSDHPDRFRLFYESGLTKYFLPECCNGPFFFHHLIPSDKSLLFSNPLTIR